MTDKTDQSLPEPAPETAAAVRRLVLGWYDEEHRPLPWRTQPGEYATVVSEFMLQQTQVATVLPYYEAFMKEFPSFRRLAEASEQDVLRAWSGLGYYRRARLLKRTAEIVTRQWRGRLPRDPADLAELPGFGRYTVGAVGSIALGLALPLVDGNVRRVVGRLFALDEDLLKGAGLRRLWAICAGLVDPARPGDFNQGLMELGATVCLPREPLCLICPLYEHCQARALGFPENYPAPPPRPRLKTVREVAVALFRKDRLLVVQRGAGKAFAGLWELPRLDTREIEADQLGPEKVLFDLLRIHATVVAPVGTADSTFTNHRIRTELFRAEDGEGQAVRRQRHVAHKWIAPGRLADLPASRAQRRLFALLCKKTDDHG
ncbi:MAG: A/G-specific adenine glycosylase [bacterium]|nr:A/G-specific adenine glycosylase [bacterium]